MNTTPRVLSSHMDVLTWWTEANEAGDVEKTRLLDVIAETWRDFAHQTERLLTESGQVERLSKSIPADVEAGHSVEHAGQFLFEHAKRAAEAAAARDRAARLLVQLAFTLDAKVQL